MFRRIILLAALIVALPLSVNAQTLSQFYGGKIPSLQVRKQIAQVAGIQNYIGTAQQNTKLVSFLQGTQTMRYFGATPSDPTANQSYNPPTGYQSILTSYIAGNAATIPVVTTKDLSGNAINLANISVAATVKVYMTLEPGNPTNQEEILCTGVTASSWTNCTRGLPFQGGSETASTTLQKPHNAGAAIIITNISQFYNQYLSVDGNQTVNNVKTFTQIPLAPTTTPTNPQQLITLYQFQQATSTGGVNGSETVKGVWQGASRTQMAAGTNVGSTGANLTLQSQYASSTSAGVTTIVVTNSSGKVDSSFGGVASSIATTNASNLVIQNPAISTSTPTANSIPIANASSTLRGWGLFNGTGVNSALAISSGTTTISAAGASELEEDFTTITINGTGALAFSNPAPNGTSIILRAAVCNITSTAQYAITTQDMGGQAGTGGTSPTDGASGNGIYTSVAGGPKGPTSGSSNATAPSAPNLATSTFSRMVNLIPGAAGGGGSGVGGRNGGNGAGALELDCGTWNVSTTINLAGRPGVVGVSQTSGQGCNGAGGSAHLGAGTDGSDNSGNTACATNAVVGGSGGGGGGGDFVGFYNFLLGFNSVTASTTGGLGQPYAGGSTLSGHGASGFSFVKQNDSLF